MTAEKPAEVPQLSFSRLHRFERELGRGENGVAKSETERAYLFKIILSSWNAKKRYLINKGIPKNKIKLVSKESLKESKENKNSA